MNKLTVEALLTPPNNWNWGELYNKNSKKIRYGFNIPENAKAIIVIAEGRSEVIEEYYELIRDFNKLGYACAIMDWQGQGLSYRYFDDYTRQHSEGFNVDIDDFHHFINTLSDIKKLNTLPKLLFAHSMGAAITLHYIAKQPNIFECAYLCAPMLGLNPKRIIKYIAKPLLKAAVKLNFITKHAIGQTPWNETFANLSKYKVSSDPVRREVQPYLFKNKPELRCGGVTYAWVAEALKLIAPLHKVDMCQKIKIPVTIAIAEKDVVVDNEGTHITAALLPHCEKISFKDSQHQIHREKDKIRDDLLQSLIIFYNSHLSPNQKA